MRLMRPRASACTSPGCVPYAEAAAHYRAADIFVLPSLMEAFGMPLVEAKVAGLPVVAARTGGIPDVVENGVTGLLVPRGDVGRSPTRCGCC